MKPARMISGFMTVGFWTLMSRILGFLRDILMASFLGTGPVAEAFLIAFSLPNMFRRFFAEGAFNMAFVPMFSKKLERGEDPCTFARDAFSGLGGILIVFSLVAHLLMPWLVIAMASGFIGDERFDLAVLYGRIAFPYILFISLSALLAGVLNASGRFAAAAAAPVFLNVVFVAAMLGADALGWPIGLTLAWAVPVSGIVQLAIVWVAASRIGFRLVPKRPRMTPDLKRLLIIAAPAALAGGVVQVNLLVGRQVASHFEGAVAWLAYADRLYQLPLGVVGIAIGVVLLPELSRRLGANDADGSRDALSRAGEISMALTIPAAVALVVIPTPLISVLFERGAFDADDTAATAVAVAIYGLGLPGFVLQKLLQPVFFAREDTKRPFYYAVVSMVINAAIAIGLAPFIGFWAAALATTVAGWFMVLLLALGARRYGTVARFDARFWGRVWRVVLAALLMGGALFGVQIVITPMFGTEGFGVLGLVILIGSGIVSYFGIGHLIGAFRIGDFRSALRR
ncbi:murein biosynthesis integral membrane protein MurJ [Halocynthiibacter sp. C4]|uniref:murein biosynthesis integral membrane protein MurJ n=1 Tax=Halocynthiibacter sp. C4 TaxID=2992758 RepID=UPI00237B1EC8|nr:murein biosynthesis integral membrane protein MurJ [Halocynthiibacter sp. C4]MDE0590353.1 murein biosynthesis integral membrane protein MurJ [Halocynthiibacter sp. C4]